MLVVYNTCPDKESAEKIARHLVQIKLAACVNIIKIEQSVYEWKGKICEEPEFLLIIKAKDGDYGKIENEIRSMHTYSVPEIIALRVKKGNKRYVDWVEKLNP